MKLLFVLHASAGGFLLLDHFSYGTFLLMPSYGFIYTLEYFFHDKQVILQLPPTCKSSHTSNSLYLLSPFYLFLFRPWEKGSVSFIMFLFFLNLTISIPVLFCMLLCHSGMSYFLSLSKSSFFSRFTLILFILYTFPCPVPTLSKLTFHSSAFLCLNLLQHFILFCLVCPVCFLTPVS